MLRTALRPRFLGLLALMVVATLVCGLLATWQWDRAHQAITDEADGAEHRGALEDVLDVGDPVTNAIVGDIVTATGHYEPDDQIVVPGRHIDGTDAAIVVTALRVDLADGTTGYLPVARGWMPAEDLTGPDGEIDPGLAPPVPSGEVEVTGRLEAGESASGGVENGVAPEIATTMLVNVWGSPMYAGYVAQVDPNAGLHPMPEAESTFSKGLDLQNIGYSFQWVLFGGFFLYLWWRSVRTAHLDELDARREAMEETLRGSAPNADGSDRHDDHREPAVAGSPTSTSPTPDKDV
ncbi:hypothetical protein BH708_18185 [Brachybacterium sp. P6-10-X1]|uniref:SURF1 family protein n=1 Tax=Brachybacterium sp. P6-10-X1 TaxID=1903186 RepID=UPI000971B823|nr:SURF1 family protein [Brachybacterium sp. P6-10-X1]APX34316.1 hypothetical protein BH708_18185 [Brachybacterium sp. P6-10-X1]